MSAEGQVMKIHGFLGGCVYDERGIALSVSELEDVALTPDLLRREGYTEEKVPGGIVFHRDTISAREVEVKFTAGSTVARVSIRTDVGVFVGRLSSYNAYLDALELCGIKEEYE